MNTSRSTCWSPTTRRWSATRSPIPAAPTDGRWCRRRDEHGLALEGAAIFLEIRLHLQVHDHRWYHLPSVGAAGVGDRVADHRRVVGLQHVDRDVFIVPGHTKV